jgi:hypothetical protein
MQLNKSWLLHLLVINGNNAANKNFNTFDNVMAVKKSKKD